LVTPEFDHRDSGTPAAVWAKDRRFERAAPLDLADIRQVVVLAAHPDDETLGAGGLISRAGRSGIAVTVVFASLGEASHPASRSHDPGRLAEIRRVEATAALAGLDPAARSVFLELPDGRLSEHVEAISAALRDVSRPGALLVAPWIGDGHPDHAACGRAAEAVADGRMSWLEYPIWAWHWARADRADIPESGWWRLALDAGDVSAKRAALACYVSQHTALSDRPGDEAILGADFLAHFDSDRELYLGHRPSVTLDAGYFDRRYDRSDDPWGFESRWYEERKRALTLAMLPRRRFASTFEPGCGTGLLSLELAQRSDLLLAADISMAATEATRRRLTGLDHVTVQQLTVPADWPAERFDLVVLSELGYYLDDADLDHLVERAAGALSDDGVLVGCHWRHPVADHRRSGDDVHEKLAAAPELSSLARYRDDDVAVDVWVRGPATSIATVEGLV
jgi:LmbE family N-acetylglucosaminyl deacetylase/SAM-dependent methyltransferase